MMIRPDSVESQVSRSDERYLLFPVTGTILISRTYTFSDTIPLAFSISAVYEKYNVLLTYEVQTPKFV
jgi:hypothetical protein